MSLPAQEEILNYMVPLTDDPQVRARQRHMVRFLAQRVPEVRDELIQQGLDQGVEQGLQPLMHLFEHRLGRTLTDAEHRALRERLGQVGADRLGDVVLDLSAPALEAWLADPHAT